MTTGELHADLPSEAEPHSLDDLVADCVEVSRHLAEVPQQRRVLTIPRAALAVVADLDAYGD